MSIETPIKYSSDIKCPKCNHTYPYSFTIKDLEKANTTKKTLTQQTKHKFLTYLICKNPLCNYDIEVIGDVYEYPINTIKSIELTTIK